MTFAADRLRPSQLSDQLEALGYDVDLSDLELALRSRASLPILEMVTAGTITRTIEGASTLSLTLRDRDQMVRRSGIIQQGTSTVIDGLWFRLVSVSSQDADLTLTFEDREVNVLRSWPPPGTKDNGFRLTKAASLGPQVVARALFAKRLIDDVKGILAIRFVSPTLEGLPEIRTSRDRPKPEEKRQRKNPGLPKDKATVKRVRATETQRDNLERILDVGYSMQEPEDILVLAVMTVTGESTALNVLGGPGTCSAGGRAVGIFQQCPGGGRPDGQGSWPATYDIEQEARAFFEVAEYVTARIASGALPPLSPGATCSEIQRNYSYHTPQQGEPYSQWNAEAQTTVRLYLGTEILPPDPTPGTPSPPTPAPLMFPDTTDTTMAFTRGTRTTVRGRKIFKRENNWECLQRLAEEVRKRCFCVSGTVYFMSDQELFGSAPIVTISRDSPGVRSIGGTFDMGQHNAQVTVMAALDRWGAPPSSTIVIEDTGIYDGKWLVATISRSLFNPLATITLKKPRPALPESNTPEYGAGQTSGVYRPPKHGRKPPIPPPPPPVPGTVDYVFPIPASVRWWESRVDMGKDLETGPAGVGHYLFAIGNGKIVRISDGGGFGPWYTVLLLDTDWQVSRPNSNAYGPVSGAAGKAIFYGHSVEPQVQVGQSVAAGQPILRIKGVGSGGVPLSNLAGHMEIGWANPDPAGGYTALAYPHYHEGDHTAEGEDFWQWLSPLRGNTREEP